MLGRVQGGVGAVHKVFERLFGQALCNADADCAAHRLATLRLYRSPGHVDAQALRHLDGVGLAGIGQHDGELLAAQPPGDIQFPQATAQHIGQDPQHAVADGVSMGIIDQLEAVEVHHQQADR